MKTDGKLFTLLEETIVKHRTVAILLAAGSSTRMGKARNKQLEVIGGAPVLAHSLLAYQKCPLISEIIVAARINNVPSEEYEFVFRAAIERGDDFKGGDQFYNSIKTIRDAVENGIGDGASVPYPEAQ